MAHIPEHLQHLLADSAGTPWQGRSFTENPWANDDGSAPPQLAAVLARFHDGQASIVEVIDVLRESRLLIPLVAALGEAGKTEQGVKYEKSAELSIVTVQAPDGRGVVPMFTSVDAMRAWDAQARPVPVASQQAAVAAVDEGSELLILDPGSASETAIRRPAVRALAQGTPYEVPWKQPRVLDAASQLLDHIPQLAGVDLLPGDPDSRLRGAELLVVLHLPDDATEPLRAHCASRAHDLLAEVEGLADLVDSLAITVHTVPVAIPAKEPRATRAGLLRRFRRG